MRRSTSLLMGVGLLLFLGHASKAQGQAASDGSKQKDGVAASQQASPAAANDAEYKIGPQDVLRIDVWKEPEISRTTPVRPDGRISLPLINDVQAAGLTAGPLPALNSGGLREKIPQPP